MGLLGQLHFFKGSKSTIVEKGAAALLTIEASDSFDGEISQEREEEGKESNLFLQTLGGINIINSESPCPIVFDVRSDKLDDACKSYQITNFACISWHMNGFLAHEWSYSLSKWKYCIHLEMSIFLSVTNYTCKKISRIFWRRINSSC